ncbi:MAG: hypothetical protein GY716_02580 [bacterium]|nr:hypothetical protein [bacterium]
MHPESNRSSSRRNWLLLLGAAILFVVAFGLLERVVAPRPVPGVTASGTDDTQANAPAPPTVQRRNDGGVDIRHGFFHRTTIRMGSPEDDDALYECVKRAFDEAFGDGTAGRTRAQLKAETERVQDECIATFRPPRPEPPPPPDLPGQS